MCLFAAVCLISVIIGASLTAGCGDSEKARRIDDGAISQPLSDIIPSPASTSPDEDEAQSGQDALLSEIEAILSAYDVESQFAHLSELAADSYQGRLVGSAGGRAAAAYISGLFNQLELRLWTDLGLGSFSQPFSASGYSGQNIIGIIPGLDPNAGYVVMAAHFDHLGLDINGQPFNGADDNSAGVSALLETARILKKTGLRAEKTIVFCAFDGEEQGQLGAEALGGLIASAGLSSKVEVINIDGIGATGGTYFGVWDEGSAKAAPLVSALKEAGELLGVKVVEEGTDIGSDAQPLNWQFGIPAVTVDWHWGQDESAYHPYYHTIYDDADKINKAVLATASKVAIAGLWIRASK